MKLKIKASNNDALLLSTLLKISQTSRKAKDYDLAFSKMNGPFEGTVANKMVLHLGAAR